MSFLKKYSSDDEVFPVIFEVANNELEVRVSAEKINSCKSMDDLKEVIRSVI